MYTTVFGQLEFDLLLLMCTCCFWIWLATMARKISSACQDQGEIRQVYWSPFFFFFFFLLLFNYLIISNAFKCRLVFSLIRWNADRWALPELYSWIPLYKLDPGWSPHHHWASADEWGEHNGSPPQRKQTARQMFSCPLLLQNTTFTAAAYPAFFLLKFHTCHESII